MSTDGFIRDLARLLMRVDRGMLEFEEPPPEAVAHHLVQALRAFGEQAVPAIHAVLEEAWTQADGGGGEAHLVDVLAALGHPSSVPYLIELHEHHAFYLTGLAAIQALRQLKTEAAWVYLAQLLMRRANGDLHAFETPAEVVVACHAMGEWGDARAIPPLRAALHFTEHPVHGIYEAADSALAHYRELDMPEP